MVLYLRGVTIWANALSIIHSALKLQFTICRKIKDFCKVKFACIYSQYPTLHWCCDLCTCAFDEQSFISLHVHEDVPLICTINDEYGTIAWQMDLSKTLLLRKWCMYVCMYGCRDGCMCVCKFCMYIYISAYVLSIYVYRLSEIQNGFPSQKALSSMIAYSYNV